MPAIFLIFYSTILLIKNYLHFKENVRKTNKHINKWYVK